MTELKRLRLLATYLLPLALLLGGCAATGGGYNPTTNINELNNEILNEQPIKNVVIAHINLGKPSRNYVERSEPMIDGRVAAYLKDNGYKVLPQREFSQRWDNAKLIYGDPVDPTTGRINTKTFIQLISAVRDQMREQTNVDGFVFTDLIEHEVVIGAGMTRVARFHGVTRKPTLRGAGDGVTADFDWAAPIAAISLQVSLYNLELQQVFAGIGGIDLSDAVDTRSGRGFIRRRDILENEDFIDEGIQLALHPLITMRNWPGQNPEG